MIPLLVLSDEIFKDGLQLQRGSRAGNHGLKERVTACRKRLRVYRAMHKSGSVRNQSDEIFQESDSAASDSRQYTEEYSAEIAAITLGAEQEVGIT